MPCYIEKIKPPSRSDYKVWQSIGFTGTYDDYCNAKGPDVGQKMFVCGDLGPSCTDCSGFPGNLCDYPVGDGKTCDRGICDDHAHEIGPDIHYCQGHYEMWKSFKDGGGVDEALKNVIAFKAEK